MQIVEYGAATDGAPAALHIADEGTVHQEPLVPGTELSFALEERHCAGIVESGLERDRERDSDRDGDRDRDRDREHEHERDPKRELVGHVPCPRPAAPRCRLHTETWVCARCTGTCLKDEMDCFEEHAIYLAAFAPRTTKVGVTKRWRLETRLREQGADRGAHIRTVPDGRIARAIESNIATDLGDAVRIDRKFDGLHRSVDEGWWRATLEPYSVIEEYSFDYGLELSDRPVRETLAAGTVVGTQGRILILSRSGTTYAIDMRDLVGYEVRPVDTIERELQSSLDVFG